MSLQIFAIGRVTGDRDIVITPGYAPDKSDARMAELLELQQEGVKLPLPITAILFFESHGCSVCLVSGRVTLPIMPEVRFEPTQAGKAVNHLLTPEEERNPMPAYNPPPCSDTAAYDAYIKSWNDEWARRNHIKWWSRTAGK